MIAISCETWRKNDKVNHGRMANENSGEINTLSCGNNTFIFSVFIFNKYIFRLARINCMQRIHSKQQNLIYHDERITHTIVTLTTQVLPIRRLTDKEF